MGSTFNPQILVEKLAKLNNSQQSIETLSHWCIFHMNKAKLVVETWERQFHCSPREQRLAFLYLANDILQNSRRKGAEFVAEFWRVLPEALRDVIRNGDDFGRSAAFRLISIWDERKVFGSRGHILKEEFMGRQPENNNRNGRQLSVKLRQSFGTMLDKIVSDFEVIYGGQLDEDALMNRCSSTVSCMEKVVKDIGSGLNSGQFSGSGAGEELQGQHAALRECIEQLTALEASRANLVSNLREALQEQELKLEQLRSQLRAAHSQSEQAASVCRQVVSSDHMPLLDEQGLKEARTSAMPPGFAPSERQSAAPVVYTRQVPLSDKSAAAEDDTRKSAAAAVAAKLTASTASAEMLSHVLTSLVSGGIIGNSVKESPDRHSEKRAKLENDPSSYSPPPPPPPPPQGQQPPPPLPPFPHPDSHQQGANPNPTNQQMTPGEQPPPPSSSPPPLPPLPPMPPYPMVPQFIQTAGSMSNVAYSYGATQQPPPPPLPGYPSVGAPVTGMSPYAPPPVNPYQNFQGNEGGFYSPPSSVPMAPISRQQTL